MATVNPAGSVGSSSVSQNSPNVGVSSGRSVERQAASQDTAPTQQVQATQEVAEESTKAGMRLTREEIEAVAKELQRYNNRLNFEVSEHSQMNVVVEVRTADDGALVRQIPQEELLKLSERLSELDGPAV